MMNKIVDERVRLFIKNELPLVTTLLVKNIDIDDDSPLQDVYEADDIAEMAGKYFINFNVHAANFSLGNYYPWKMNSLFSKRAVNQNKTPLTIGMFIESAQVGFWLYN